MKPGLLNMLPLTAVALFLMHSGTASAQSQQPDPGAGGQESRTNESLFGDNRTSDDEEDEFRISGRITPEIQQINNLDLDNSTDDNLTRLLPEVRVDMVYEPDDDFQAVLSLEFGLDIDHQFDDWTSNERVEVREAYILSEDIIARDVEIQLGRQDVEDGREWLYDEQLDGIRLAYDHKEWRIEAAFMREGFLPNDIFDEDENRDKVDNWIFHAEYEVTRDWDIAGYVLKQNDIRQSNVSPLFFGIQSEGRIGRSFGHWIDLSLQRGEVGNRDQKAWAIDAGLIYFLEAVPARPAVFAGYARGSGGGNSDTNKEFRQTGLQDNEDRITGLGNLKYYGELLDPDLSNLEIMTLGGGVRPSPETSIEFVWHKYKQVVVDDSDIRGARIDVELEGDDPDIGDEIDLVAAARLGNGIGLETKFGWFMPGKGFDDDERGDALFGKIRLVFRF